MSVQSDGAQAGSMSKIVEVLNKEAREAVLSKGHGPMLVDILTEDNDGAAIVYLSWDMYYSQTIKHEVLLEMLSNEDQRVVNGFVRLDKNHPVRQGWVKEMLAAYNNKIGLGEFYGSSEYRDMRATIKRVYGPTAHMVDMVTHTLTTEDMDKFIDARASSITCDIAAAKEVARKAAIRCSICIVCNPN